MVLKFIQKVIQPSATDAKGFKELGLIDSLTAAVAKEGYSEPTPIQKMAIPDVLKGRDILGCAQTGTGKTAAFALPILQRLSEKDPDGPGNRHALRALVLAPTRELALQIKDSFVAYGANLPLKTVVVFGGVGIEPQIKAIRSGVDIIVATPGRLLDLMERRVVDYKMLKVLVLDEADRMLDMGFINDIKRILKQIPQKRQNLLFSATIPREVQGLIDSILVNPVRVEVAPVSSTSEKVAQRLYYVGKVDKRSLLLHIMDHEAVTRGLVFTRTKHNANKLETFLQENGVEAAAIHGNKSQGARQKALEGFRTGKVQILVASDIAARGIDIDEISHVINFEMPNEPETYVHRIGRTGRAAATGVALSFCDQEERKYVVQIERVTKKKIPVIEDHPFAKGGAKDAPYVPTPARGQFQRPRGNSPRSSSRDSNSSSNRNPNRGPSRSQSSGGRSNYSDRPPNRSDQSRGPNENPNRDRAGRDERPDDRSSGPNRKRY